MDKAVARIRQAVEKREKVAVYGDYDVDGLTASALIATWLRRQGLECITYIPERLTEGYGITEEALTSIAGEGVTLLVTVDCGVTACAQVEHARSLGIDVVITDHHECLPELPKAAAVVDPQKRTCPYPFKGLAGVGVAFKLVCALEGPERLEAVLEDYGPLVALGTIADIMPVIGENRCLIRQGITILRRKVLPGLDALMQAIGLDKRTMRGTDVSFSLVPKLNAAGRMGSVRTAYDLLMAEDPGEASRLADELIEMNNARKAVENRVFTEALELLEGEGNVESPIVLASDTWHHGVSGIVASRLAERYGVPTVVICLEGDEGRGSCRSPGDFCLFDALGEASDLLTTFGGHAMAAGLTLPRENVDALRSRLAQLYRASEGERLQSRIPVDFALEDLGLLSLEEIEGLRQLAPWGVGNPPPTLCIRDARVDSVTSIGGDRHLKMSVSRDGIRLDCVFFGLSVRELGIRAGTKVDMAFEPGINEFRGSRTVQLLLRSVRPARQSGEPTLPLARRFFAGERMLPMELALICPDRNDMGRIWRYLTGRSRRFAEETDTLLPEIGLRAQVPAYGRILVALRVFDELGLLRLQEQDGRMDIHIPRFEGKADLNASKILQRLR
jgi:single-stranded-DNA-specific exonuclease